MENPKSITVIEKKDKYLYHTLNKKFNDKKNVKILKGDILKFRL